MEFNFVFKIITRAFWVLIFLGVLILALAFAIFLYPELLSILVAIAMLAFGSALISFAFWLRKYSKINFKL